MNPQNNMLSKRSHIQKQYALYDSIYMHLKDRKN